MTYANKVWGYEDIFEHVKRGESDTWMVLMIRCSELCVVSGRRHHFAIDQEDVCVSVEKGSETRRDGICRFGQSKDVEITCSIPSATTH